MFGKQCLKLGSKALLLIAALVAGGCGSTTLYRATPEDTRDLSLAQARKLLIKAAQTNDYCFEIVSVTYEKIKLTCKETGKRKTFRLAESPALVAILETDPLGANETCINASGSRHGVADSCMFWWWRPKDANDARDLVRAWYVLAREGTVFYLAQEAAFESAAQSYRNATIKPQLPEEAVRYKVQAEAVVRQKRFDDAVNLYEQALDIAMWWSQGHYNRGLILGEIGEREEAVVELKRYLKLEPDASNARAVQLKIYEWEGTGK